MAHIGTAQGMSIPPMYAMVLRVLMWQGSQAVCEEFLPWLIQYRDLEPRRSEPTQTKRDWKGAFRG